MTIVSSLPQRLLSYFRGSGLGPQVMRSVAGSAGLRLSGMFFGFLVGVQLARGLGAEGYGIYGLAMSIIALLSVPIEFGMPQLVTREVASAQALDEWERLKGILRWSRRNVLLGAAAMLVVAPLVLMAGGYPLDSPFSMTLLAALAAMVFTVLGNLYGAALRGLQQIVKGQFAETLLRPAAHSFLLLAAMLLAIPMQPVVAMGLGAAAAALSMAVSMRLLNKSMPAEAVTCPAVQQSADWWRTALPMALTEGMRVLQGHLMVLLLGWLATIPMVGLYRVAASVALMLAVPATLLNVINAPLIARLHAQAEQQKLQRLVSFSAAGMAGGTLLLLLPFLVAGETLFGMVFGEEFQAANAVLLILGGSALVTGFLGPNATLLNMTGHHQRVTRASFIAVVLLIVIAPFLIVWYGVLGAAAAYGFSMLTWNGIMWRDARSRLSLDTSLVPIFR